MKVKREEKNDSIANMKIYTGKYFQNCSCSTMNVTHIAYTQINRYTATKMGADYKKY